jgi:hypothetical protein
MRFAPDDDMIETLAPDRSDQPFGKAILQGEAGAIAVCPECPWHAVGV